MIRACFGLAALTLTFCASPPAPPPVSALVTPRAGDIAIVDVNVVPMDREGTLPHRTVLVRGDRIVAVAPTGSLELGPETTRVDGAGKWLIPGLADMHVHTWTESELTLFVAAGVTTVRNMFGGPVHLEWRDRIARGELLGPTIVTAGPIIDGDPPVWPSSTVLTRPEDAERVVTEQQNAGYDFLKAYQRLKSDVYDALVAAAKKHGMALAGHVPATVGLPHVLESRQRSVEHLDGWIKALLPPDVVLPATGFAWKELGEALPRLQLDRLPELVKKTVDAGSWNCPTLVVWNHFAKLEDPHAFDHLRWIETVAPTTLASWSPKADFRLQAMTAESFATLRKTNELRGRIVAELERARAPILVGTDMGNPYVIAGAGLYEEIELLVRAGVSRPRVLRAATAGAAEYLGKKGDAGVIATGARADLVLVAADPLVVPMPLPPEGVMLRGRWLPHAELKTKLADAVKAAAEPPSEWWKSVSPLAAEGQVLQSDEYEMLMGGQPIGGERLAVTKVDGQRVIVSQVLYKLGERALIASRITPRHLHAEIELGAGKATLDASVEGRAIAIAGADAKGAPISLNEPLAEGTFLATSGMSATILLAERVASLEVGGTTTVASRELTYFPKPQMEPTTYEVERRPDAGGNRVYTVTTSVSGVKVPGDLTVGMDGRPIRQFFGSPFNMEIKRKPPAASAPAR